MLTKKQKKIPSLLVINFRICQTFAILNYPTIVIYIGKDTSIDCNFFMFKFTLKVKCRQNRTEISSLLAINFGICEIFAILNYPTIVNCIDYVTAIDYKFLVYNFTFQVQHRQHRTEIPSLHAISFGICEIIAILYHLNLVSKIQNLWPWPFYICHSLLSKP